MTCFIEVGGVEVAGTVKLPGLQSVSARADGSYTDSGLLIDDPGGTATYQQLSLVTIEETASANPRAFTGYVHRTSIGRGPYRDGAARVHELEVADLNFLLHLRALSGYDSKRPAETFNARMTWLLASWALNGVVWDDGLVMSSTTPFDEADYTGRYADDVLADIAGTLGLVFFVRWDPSTSRPSLFLDYPSAAVHDSTLRISNVDTDVDSTTTFAPLADSDVTGAGEDIYDGIYYRWVGPAIYRTRTSTYTAFGVHRDASYETTRVGRLATAEAEAQRFLDNHAGQVDTITCSIRLPRSKLTLIEAGMRIQVRFSHLPGYTSFTWVRVTAMTFTFASGRNDFYEVQLELSNRGLTSIGGGRTGDFPLPEAADHWYEGTLTVCAPVGVTTIGLDTDPHEFLADTTYDYSWEIVTNTAPGGAGVVTYGSDVTTANLIRLDYTGPDWNLAAAPTATGSFTVGGSPRIAVFGLGVLHNDIAEGCTQVHFWIDPDGWVVPETPVPQPGQWVYQETPTMVGPAGTTAFAFADGSLTVWVDDIDQTAALVSYDGAAGTFLLSFDPTSTEQVRVDYQGI